MKVMDFGALRLLFSNGSFNFHSHSCNVLLPFCGSCPFPVLFFLSSTSLSDGCPGEELRVRSTHLFIGCVKPSA